MTAFIALHQFIVDRIIVRWPHSISMRIQGLQIGQTSCTDVEPVPRNDFETIFATHVLSRDYAALSGRNPISILDLVYNVQVFITRLTIHLLIPELPLLLESLLL